MPILQKAVQVRATNLSMAAPASSRRESIVIGSWSEMVEMPAYEIKKCPHALNTFMAMPANTRRESTVVGSWSQIIAMCEKTAANVAATKRHQLRTDSFLHRVEQIETDVCGASYVAKMSGIGFLRRLSHLERKVLPGGRAVAKHGDAGTTLERLQQLEHTVTIVTNHLTLNQASTETNNNMTQAEWTSMKDSLIGVQKADQELSLW